MAYPSMDPISEALSGVTSETPMPPPAGFRETAMQAMAYFPSMKASMAFTSGRGARTILGGGWREGGKPLGFWRGAAENTLSPHFFTRFSDVGIFSPERMSKENKLYTPFQGAGIINRIASNVVTASEGGELAGRMGRVRSKIYGMFSGAVRDAEGKPRAWVQLGANGKPLTEQTVLHGGYLSRMNAASTMWRQGSRTINIPRVSEPQLSNINKFLGAVGESPFEGPIRPTMVEAGNAISMAGVNSKVLARASGYMSGVMTRTAGDFGASEAGKIATAAAARGAAAMGGEQAIGLSTRAAWRTVIKPQAIKQAESTFLKQTGKEVLERAALNEGESLALKALEKTAISGAATRFAGGLGLKAAGMAIPGVNVVMAAMMAVDVAKLGMTLAKGAIEGGMNLAKDSANSAFGALNAVPGAGLGFKDNTIAATSRSRGVMAIQNSRLNARSLLGNEASFVHNHFSG